MRRFAPVGGAIALSGRARRWGRIIFSTQLLGRCGRIEWAGGQKVRRDGRADSERGELETKFKYALVPRYEEPNRIHHVLV
jgi:hypothetical protein